MSLWLEIRCHCGFVFWCIVEYFARVIAERKYVMFGDINLSLLEGDVTIDMQQALLNLFVSDEGFLSTMFTFFNPIWDLTLEHCPPLREMAESSLNRNEVCCSMNAAWCDCDLV